jgi:nicotinamide mononucleotide transporter
MNIIEQLNQTIINMHWAEITGVFCGLVYVILAARENIWCWFWGILNALVSIYLFFAIKLYAESILYLFYFFAGIYGWYAWKYARRVSQQHGIVEWTWSRHLLVVLAGVAGSLGVYFLLQNYTDAQKPLIDAHTTIFSFIATYMVTRKVLSNWLYWIVIDAVSVGLYASRGLYLYALLMLLYTILAIYGYWEWRKSRRLEK